MSVAKVRRRVAGEAPRHQFLGLLSNRAIICRALCTMNPPPPPEGGGGLSAKRDRDKGLGSCEGGLGGEC